MGIVRGDTRLLEIEYEPDLGEKVLGIVDCRFEKD